MTYHAYVGPGAQIVEQTLNTLVQHSQKSHVSDAIIAALRYLRHVVGATQGKAGLRRFDRDVLDLFNKYRSEPEKLALELDVDHLSISPSCQPERIKAMLVDAVENCLLLNAKGELTSTDVLIDIFTSYLIALNDEDASLGDLLLDVNNYRQFPPNSSHLWQTLSLH